MAPEKHSQSLASVAVVIVLLVATYPLVAMVAMALFESGTGFAIPYFWRGLACGAPVGGGMALLVFHAAAARLTFASENRSTRLRALMLLEYAIIVGVVAWAGLGWTPPTTTPTSS